MAEAINPYAPPKARVEDVVPFASEAEEIRREHIRAEASVRSIGSLYYIGATVICIAALAMLAGSASFSRVLTGRSGLPVGLMGGIYLVIGVLSFFVARGIRQLRPWARITAIVLAFIGLLNAPTGTIINIYILYLLFSKKGKRIFESDYPQIIAATPDIKSKTSAVTWFLLAVLILLVLVGVGVAFFHK